ncbi:hypothetical protein IPV09_09015 [Tessaracoccus sp. SD287]|uniref:hypothetical protein n=1 Tax=Tessaracoccus sp. SD287 TaxID=2782008 RepID=UPI001A960F90|nr:hypothetical protein [Tessaracoccus sp. SD287]MBO1031475.1 hypothetical protein [Tessaracoccus sp. SD287]
MRMIPRYGLVVLTGALTLAGCGSAPASTPAPLPSSSAHEDEHDEHEEHGSSDGETQGVDARAPRLALTHAGGVMVVDATTMKLISDLPQQGFLRLRPTGNARFTMVDADGSALKVLDLGSWTQAHGDHGDSKVTTPGFTATTLAMKKTGHVSPHGGLTAVFDDGDGSIEVYESQHLGEPNPTPVRTLTVPAHHGNAIPLADGKLLHTIAQGPDPVGIRLVDAAGATLAESSECPGTHGATVAKDAVVIGCEDGVLLVKGDTITKVKAAADFARLGNLFGSSESPWVLADYKLSADAKPTEVAIINTVEGTINLVKMPTAYTFRGLAFTAEGQALVLTNDGQLHIIEPDHGHIETSIKVVEPFTEPTDWKQPRPTIHTQGHWVYVTDPATKKVHGIELSVGEVKVSGTLPHVPHEITGTLG